MSLRSLLQHPERDVDGAVVRRLLGLLASRTKEHEMQQVHEGQCGLCAHFGEHQQGQAELIQIRMTKSAPEDLVEDCGHPQHAGLSLKVTPISGCTGFEPAEDDPQRPA